MQFQITWHKISDLTISGRDVLYAESVEQVIEMFKEHPPVMPCAYVIFDESEDIVASGRLTYSTPLSKFNREHDKSQLTDQIVTDSSYLPFRFEKGIDDEHSDL